MNHIAIMTEHGPVDLGPLDEALPQHDYPFDSGLRIVAQSELGRR